MSASQKEFANLADILLFVCAVDDFLTTDWYFYAIEIVNRNNNEYNYDDDTNNDEDYDKHFYALVIVQTNFLSSFAERICSSLSFLDVNLLPCNSDIFLSEVHFSRQFLF